MFLSSDRDSGGCGSHITSVADLQMISCECIFFLLVPSEEIRVIKNVYRLLQVTENREKEVKDEVPKTESV